MITAMILTTAQALIPFKATVGTRASPFVLIFGTYTNEALVARIFLDMNTRKSCGHDLTPPKLVKESAAAISKLIAKILNAPVDQGYYFKPCKAGQLTPLFKKAMNLTKQTVDLLQSFLCFTIYRRYYKLARRYEFYVRACGKRT